MVNNQMPVARVPVPTIVAAVLMIPLARLMLVSNSMLMLNEEKTSLGI